MKSKDVDNVITLRLRDSEKKHLTHLQQGYD